MDVFKDEVRAWIAANWDPDLSLVEWRTRLVDARLARPSWPQEWFGRGLPSDADDIIDDELRAVGAPGVPGTGAMALAAPTILAHGSDDVKSRLLRTILTGEQSWCQLFSEPGNGSDLAGLTTRAERDGDEWVINGQKVWNTSAHHADMGMLVARTDWNVPKHRGITYFALPMHQPGIEVRPLRQMNGYASFNEVFFTDARIPADNVIGEVGHGWAATLTTLAHERRFATMRAAGTRTAPVGRAQIEARAEADDYHKVYEWYPQRAGRADLAIEFAKLAGRNTDPVVRQKIAGLIAMQRASQWTANRAAAARRLGRPPGAEGSLGKLAISNVARACAEVHTLIGGATGMLSGPTTPFDGAIASVLVSVPAQSIAGGTDEIQRNIIGEQVLGLPKEPQLDRDVPFREVRRN